MDYDPKKRIKFAHLTNNCLVKKFEKIQRKQKSVDRKAATENSPDKTSPEKFDADGYNSSDVEPEADDEDEEMGNIWSHESFAEYLQSNYKDKYPENEDIFKEIIFS